MRSDAMKAGLTKMPHRALFKAEGLTDEEISRPMIGIVNSFNEVVPGHIHLRTIAEAVKAGVRMAGGTPLEFPAIAVCDGIAMNHEGMRYSLISREHIAESVEIMASAHTFDGLVFIPNCDKVVPGMLMAALRVNIPAIFVSGGPMLPGRRKGKKMHLTTAFEAVGAYNAGRIGQEEFEDIENYSCPGCGSCAGMFTANSMNCLTEVIGMGLPGNGTIPAVYAERVRLAKRAGMKIMELVEKRICPADILTERAFKNALAADMALGCSTNTVLHLPAIAHEAGLSVDLEEINRISAAVPHLVKLAPAGDQGRTGNAGNAFPHLGIGGTGTGQYGSPDHGRPLFRRVPGRFHRPCLTRGGRGRAHRPGPGRGFHQHRYPRPLHQAECGAGRAGAPAAGAEN